MEVTKEKSDVEVVKKKILLYAITRVMPKTKNLNLEEAISLDNLVRMFNYFDQMSKSIPKELLQTYKD